MNTPPPAEKLIYSDDEGVEIYGFRSTESNLYRDVLQVRNDGKLPLNDELVRDYDSFSDHYIGRLNDKPFATVTATRVSDGAFECQEFCPPEILKEFGQVAMSGCCAKVLPDVASHATLPILIREGWRDQVKKGVRLDIINATGRLIPIYRRYYGYRLLGEEFTHPRLLTPTRLLYLAVDPERDHRLARVFQGVNDPLPTAEIEKLMAPRVAEEAKQ
ncbi:MAG: hypothetical protein AAFP90_15795 [Planctomycetota bacterium]